ncbi:sensor histidine kinase [candidate division KSB1 bacterium]|nr:HAMP domain-containing histidine kinase [candidate division KSB1 bacterium]RQW05216.1 MAG: sensor histidine kinase [candidate division KSB1 bacterium]
MSGQRLDFNKNLVNFIHNMDPGRSAVENGLGVRDERNQYIRSMLDPLHCATQSDIFSSTLERVLYAALVFTQADCGFISLRNLENKIEFKLGRDKQNHPLHVRDFVIDRNLIRNTIQNEQPMCCNYKASASPHPSVKKQNILIAPLFLYSDLVGLIYLQSCQTLLPASSSQWPAFLIFLEQASIAIRNLQYNKLKDEFATEKGNLQKSLIQSDNLAMKGRMAAKIGHEMNNFLSGIQANIEMAADLVRNKGKKSNIIERLEKAQEMIMSMASLSNSLMSRDGFEANIEKSSLNQVVDKFVDFVKPIYKYSNVVIDKELDRFIPQVEIDNGLMIQVLFNLVKNAVEAKPDARILLKTYFERQNKKVNLRVHDNGPGIPPEKQQKIFKPLYTDKANGHGYGLAICRDIVLKHNGDIHVESKPGEGTTFVISLPINVDEDYAQVEFDTLERLEVRRARTLKNGIKTKKKRTITNPPYRPISNGSRVFSLK